MITRTISISNMKEADEEKISGILHDVWGVRNIKINTDKGTATISYDENAASMVDFTQAMVDSGYEINEENEATF